MKVEKQRKVKVKSEKEPLKEVVLSPNKKLEDTQQKKL